MSLKEELLKVSEPAKSFFKKGQAIDISITFVNINGEFETESVCFKNANL